MKASILGFCYVGCVAAADLGPDSSGDDPGRLTSGLEPGTRSLPTPIPPDGMTPTLGPPESEPDPLDRLLARAEIVLIAYEDDEVRECITALGERVLIIDLRGGEQDALREPEPGRKWARLFSLHGGNARGLRSRPRQ